MADYPTSTGQLCNNGEPAAATFNKILELVETGRFDDEVWPNTSTSSICELTDRAYQACELCLWLIKQSGASELYRGGAHIILGSFTDDDDEFHTNVGLELCQSFPRDAFVRPSAEEEFHKEYLVCLVTTRFKLGFSGGRNKTLASMDSAGLEGEIYQYLNRIGHCREEAKRETCEDVSDGAYYECNDSPKFASKAKFDGEATEAGEGPGEVALPNMKEDAGKVLSEPEKRPDGIPVPKPFWRVVLI